MTELALSGLATPLLGGYLNPPRNPRSEPASTQPSEAGETREAPRESDERVVSGEVLRASDNTYSHLKQSPNHFSDNNNFSSSTSSQARRFNLQAAIQTFRDTEAIVVDQNRAVQVSGIIDVYA